MKMNEIAHTEEVLETLENSKEVPTGSEPVIVCLADVQREEVEWLWPDRIAKGKLTILEGDPGVGKSWLTMALASAITIGSALPGDDKRDPSDVLLLTAEDGLADTIRPRIEDMGGDVKRVKVLTAKRNQEGKEEHFSLVNDIEVLEAAFNQGKYSLVIIDPLNAYLGTDIDTNKDAALRTVFTPLTQLAERYSIAVVCVRHLTKGSRDRAIYRGQGSIAYTAAARVVHLIGINPDDENERAIVCIKNNLALFPPALAFEIGENGFKWNGETTLTAEMLLGSNALQEKETALFEAEEYLTNKLSSGTLKAEQVESEARDLGISIRTLKRAKKAIGIEVTKQGFGHSGYWLWSLPKETKVIKETKPSPEKNLALLSTSDHQHDYNLVTNQAGTHYRCKNCGEFPPKE